MLSRLESREKLPMYNTVDDAVFLIRNSKHILILTGAGISTYFTRRCLGEGIERLFSILFQVFLVEYQTFVLGMGCMLPSKVEGSITWMTLNKCEANRRYRRGEFNEPSLSHRFDINYFKENPAGESSIFPLVDQS